MSSEINKLLQIRGDASSRKFYRNKKKTKSSIVIISKIEKKKNLIIFDAVNRLLNQNKIIAPKLYGYNLKKNYIEIEDFGKNTVFEILKRNKKNNLKILKKIIFLLKNMQKIKKNKVKNLKGDYYKIPNYTSGLLFKEAKLFCDWYVPISIKKKKIKLVNKEIQKKIKFLLRKLKQKNDAFVHRDFHVSNLMISKRGYGVIDSQDAVIGNKAYDLASLIDDVRYKTSNKLKEKLFKYYLKINKKNIEMNKYKNDFDILSVLRNLKIIGIFTRLAKRDKKIRYLKLIPYTWSLIELRTKNNFLFKDLKIFLDKNFSKKIRNKYGN